MWANAHTSKHIHTHTHRQRERKTDSVALSLHISLFGVTITAKLTTTTAITRTNSIWHTFKIASSQNKHTYSPNPFATLLCSLSRSLSSLCLSNALPRPGFCCHKFVFDNMKQLTYISSSACFCGFPANKKPKKRDAKNKIQIQMKVYR